MSVVEMLIIGTAATAWGLLWRYIGYRGDTMNRQIACLDPGDDERLSRLLERHDWTRKGQRFDCGEMYVTHEVVG